MTGQEERPGSTTSTGTGLAHVLCKAVHTLVRPLPFWLMWDSLSTELCY